MTSEHDAFCELETAVSDLLALSQVIASIGPGSECPTEHLVNVVGYSTQRLDSAWNAFTEARHAAKSAG
jgi:hypothetical protein